MAQITRGQTYAVVSPKASVTRGQVYAVIRPKAKKKPVVNFSLFTEEIPVTILTVPIGTVSTDLTNFPMKINLADLPSSFWDNVSADGGNIRISTSADVELPIDLISIDTVTKTGTLFLKATILTATDNIFKISTPSGEVVRDPTDPTGRYTVWSDYNSVMLMDGTADRVAGGRTLTLVGGATVSGGYLNTGGGSHAKVPNVSKLTDWTIGVSASLTTFGGNRTVVSYGSTGASYPAIETITYRNASSRFGTWNDTDGWALIPSASAINTEYRFHLTHTNTLNRKLYVDGAIAVTDNGVVQRPGALGNEVALGAENMGSEFMSGKLRYFYLRSGELSASWIAAEKVSWTGSGFYVV